MVMQFKSITLFVGKYLYLHFVFEFVKVIVFVFKYYSEYLTPTLLERLARHISAKAHHK